MIGTPGAGPSASPTRLRLTTHSAAETRQLAAALSRVARPGDRIALVGPLGAGKTQFAKGFAEGLGVHEVVNSPSFTLMAEYQGRLPLFHQDLYRLSGMPEILAGGLLDERQDVGVTLSEWAERLDDRLDEDRLRVTMDPGLDDVREIELAARPGDLAHRYLGAAAAWLAARRAGRATG